MDLKVNEEWLKEKVKEMAKKNRQVEVNASGEQDYTVNGEDYTMTVEASAEQNNDGITLNIKLRGSKK